MVDTFSSGPPTELGPFTRGIAPNGGRTRETAVRPVRPRARAGRGAPARAAGPRTADLRHSAVAHRAPLRSSDAVPFRTPCTGTAPDGRPPAHRGSAVVTAVGRGSGSLTGTVPVIGTPLHDWPVSAPGRPSGAVARTPGAGAGSGELRGRRPGREPGACPGHVRGRPGPGFAPAGNRGTGAGEPGRGALGSLHRRHRSRPAHRSPRTPLSPPPLPSSSPARALSVRRFVRRLFRPRVGRPARSPWAACRTPPAEGPEAPQPCGDRRGREERDERGGRRDRIGRAGPGHTRGDGARRRGGARRSATPAAAAPPAGAGRAMSAGSRPCRSPGRPGRARSLTVHPAVHEGCGGMVHKP
jgi:hypothetical protein